jgi:hypothetical protein
VIGDVTLLRSMEKIVPSKISRKLFKIKSVKKTRQFFLIFTVVFLYLVLNVQKYALWLNSEHKEDKEMFLEHTDFRLFVHYSYFEEGRTALCDVLTKRLNLATFLKVAVKQSNNVFFSFAISGRLPSATTFYNSIDIEPLYGDYIFPQYRNVHVKVLDYLERVPDLCHHARAVELMSRRRTSYDYVLFLNDGVRAPMLSKNFTQEFVDIGHLSAVPVWISELASLLVSNSLIKAVGPVLSCEISLHLQGWYILSKIEIIDWWIPVFMKTCDPLLPWDASIRQEVEFTTTILNKGGRVAALFPEIMVVDLDDHNSFSVTKFWSQRNKKLKEKLYQCRNPLVAQQLSQKALDVAKLSAIKYGGNFYRLDIFNRKTKILIEKITSEIMGTHSPPNEECWLP